MRMFPCMSRAHWVTAVLLQQASYFFQRLVTHRLSLQANKAFSYCFKGFTKPAERFAGGGTV